MLRGIGDPRAVPALIRAIPRLARPSGSDCGYTIKNDPELLKFMQENDNPKCPPPFVSEEAEKYPGGGTLSTTGVRSTRSCRRSKDNGRNHRWPELASRNVGISAEQNRLNRLEFQKLAWRWDEWWEKNWRKFVKDEGEAEFEPT